MDSIFKGANLENDIKLLQLALKDIDRDKSLVESYAESKIKPSYSDKISNSRKQEVRNESNLRYKDSENSVRHSKESNIYMHRSPD